MEGWIKIHRQIKDHWLWRSDRRLKWWIDILLTVNHNDSKVLIKGKLIECKRGQSIRSLETWAKEWNVTKGAVRDFFKLLESDQMLYTESLQITTRITVCKYEEYQTELHAEKTHRKRTGNAQETHRIPKQEGEEGIKKEKNEKNIIPPSFEMVKSYCEERNSSVDPETFINWNTAKGWKVGKNKMEDWQASIRTWEGRDRKNKIKISKNEYREEDFKN